MECQQVVDGYRSMMEEERDLTPLESNLYKSDPAVISHIIHMIEVDNSWHQKTSEVVFADLQRNQDIETYNQENRTLHCKENTKTHEESDENEIIDLSSESQTMTSNHWKDKPSKKQESHDMDESKAITRIDNKNRSEKDFQVQETEGDEVAMVCWENLEGFLAEEPNEETGSQDGRVDDKMEKPKYEEEHVDHTLHTGNLLKILIKEFSLGMEDDMSTLTTHETAQD